MHLPAAALLAPDVGLLAASFVAAAAAAGASAAAAGAFAASFAVAALGRSATQADFGELSAPGLPAFCCQSSKVDSRLGGMSVCIWHIKHDAEVLRRQLL